jgi:hypothetical protein
LFSVLKLKEKHLILAPQEGKKGKTYTLKMDAFKCVDSLKTEGWKQPTMACLAFQKRAIVQGLECAALPKLGHWQLCP